MKLSADQLETLDKIEYNCWRQNTTISKDSLKEQLETEGGVSTPKDEWSLRVDALFELVSSRKQSLGSRYPLSVERNSIIYSGSPEGDIYTYCLWLSVADTGDIVDEDRSGHFEAISCSAVVNYLGGEGVATGAKFRLHGHNSYRDVVDKVQTLFPEIHPRDDYNAPNGDEGWDFIVAKAFCDNDYPRIAAFGNCSTGRTDVYSKGGETSIEHWFQQFFNMKPTGPTIKCFCVPFDDPKLRSRKSGGDLLFFDRHRIAQFASPSDPISAKLRAIVATQIDPVALL